MDVALDLVVALDVCYHGAPVRLILAVSVVVCCLLPSRKERYLSARPP